MHSSSGGSAVDGSDLVAQVLQAESHEGDVRACRFSCAHVTEKMFAASVSLSARSSFPCQRDGCGVSGVGFSERFSNTGDMRIVGVSVCCVEPRNLCLVYDSPSTAGVPRVRITEAAVQVSKFDVWQ